MRGHSSQTMIMLLRSRTLPELGKQLAAAAGEQQQAQAPAVAQLFVRSMHGMLHHQKFVPLVSAAEGSSDSDAKTVAAWVLGAFACAGVLCSTGPALADVRTPWQPAPASATLSPVTSAHASRHTAQQDMAIVQTLTQDPTCASAVALTAPLCLLLGSCAPIGPAAMSALADAALTSLTQFTAGTQQACTWELAALARGLALLAGPGLRALAPPLVSELQRVLLSACQPGSRWPLQDLASLAWSVSVVIGGLTSEELTALQAALSQLPQRGAAAKHTWDDGSCLLLLDTLLLTAARLGGRGSCDPSGPRTSKAAVQSLAQACGSAAARAIIETYDAYMPLEPHVPGALFPQLHAALCIQHFSTSQSAGSKPASSWLFLLSPQDSTSSQLAASSAMQALARPECMAAASEAQSLLTGHLSHELAGLKRDLHWHWRQDQAVDARQRAANEAAYVLGQALGQAVLRPPDADVVLPQHRLVIFITDDAGAPAAVGAGSKPPMTLTAGQDALACCARERFRPVARYGAAASAGLNTAHMSMLHQLGWRVAVLGTTEWAQLYGSAPGSQLGMSPPSPECTARVRAWLDSCLRT